MALVSRDPEQVAGLSGIALNVMLPFVGPLYVSTGAVERAATGFPFVAVVAGAVSFALAALMLCDVLARIY